MFNKLNKLSKKSNYKKKYNRKTQSKKPKFRLYSKNFIKYI